MCGHSVSILVRQQIIMDHFYSIVWTVLIFSARGLVLHCYREFLKYNLVSAFEYSFRNDNVLFVFFVFLYSFSFSFLNFSLMLEGIMVRV